MSGAIVQKFYPHFNENVIHFYIRNYKDSIPTLFTKSLIMWIINTMYIFLLLDLKESKVAFTTLMSIILHSSKTMPRMHSQNKNRIDMHMYYWCSL